MATTETGAAASPARVADARPGREVPRRRAEHDAQVVGPGRVSAFYTPGGHRRYRRSDLDQFLDRSGPGGARRASTAGPLVLIVDDDERVREYVRVNLEAEGYEVREAGSAEEGLDGARGGVARPDPARRDDAAGRRLGDAARVQEQHGVGAIPVIMFSGKVDEERRPRRVARRAGVHRQAVRPARADRVDEAAAAGLERPLERPRPRAPAGLGRRPPARHARLALRGALRTSARSASSGWRSQLAISGFSWRRPWLLARVASRSCSPRASPGC